MPGKSRDRLEHALARIADPQGEGARACPTVYADAARAAADAADARSRHGMALGPLDGVILTIKDLFDVAGKPTRAGSKILTEEAMPAASDAPAIRRLRQAGGIIVAKTNMSEFAFSGIGANPHLGTPGNPADRARVPGGSSSGAAVAAADAMCEIAIGSDTGGSTRIPAALCGIVGYKPSRQRIPTQGAFPLSYTLDSIGPMARSVADCAAADAVMAGEEPPPLEPAPLAGLRCGLASGWPMRDLDATVGKRFPQALDRLTKAGVLFSTEELPLLEAMLQVNRKGGIVPAEAYAIHRERLARRGGDIDPNVRLRIERGGQIPAADYIEMLCERAGLARAMDARLADLDALVMPTVPIVAPLIEEVATPTGFTAKNTLLLRNAGIANFFDLCAVSLPLRQEGELPVGFMLVARNGHDRKLFRIAAAFEQVFAS
jgi:aspartyl-tRNA(Asn)/glutamyl-tRNA(Gln) amidotransferase subunit A